MTTPLLSPRAVAEATGFSLRTVLKALGSGALVGVRFHARGTWRVEPAAVDLWVTTHRAVPRVAVSLVPGLVPARQACRRDISHLLPPRSERMFT